MNFFGAIRRLYNLEFRKYGATDEFSQSLVPNPDVVQTDNVIVNMPYVTAGICTLPTVAQLEAGYQPLAAELTALAGLAGPGIIVNDGASGAVARSVEAAADKGLSVSNGDGAAGNPSLSLSIANLQLEDATLNDKMIFGDNSDNDEPKYVTIQSLANLIGPASFSYATTWLNTDDELTVVIEHSLGSKDVIVQLYDVESGATINIDSVSRNTIDQVTLGASEVPPGQYGWRVLITKCS